MNLYETFEKFNEDFLKFERIENKLHSRPDLCAFLLLDKLVPGKTDMVAGAVHDEIFLDVDAEKFSQIATEDDVLYLVRCGVRFTVEYGLCMFA